MTDTNFTRKSNFRPALGIIKEKFDSNSESVDNANEFFKKKKKTKNKTTMGRKKFKDKDFYLRVREVRMKLLARPRNLATLPQGFDYQENINRPPKAALSFKTTERLKCLATLDPKKITPKYRPPTPQQHYVPRAALLYVPSKNVERLAVRAKRMPKVIAEKEKELDEMQHEMELKKIVFAKNRAKWLKMRAEPRGIPKRHKHPVEVVIVVHGKKLFIREDQLEDYMARSLRQRRTKRDIDWKLFDKLSVPTKITPKYKVLPVKDTYFETRARNLKAPLSKRMGELYQPRTLPEEALLDLNYVPFTVAKASLKYQITPRMEELAQPFTRSEEDDEDEIDDYVFSVPRKALRAKCSKRLAELARPIMRD